LFATGGYGKNILVLGDHLKESEPERAMFKYKYGRRLDNIDYENMSFADRWCFSDTVILITSFDMEMRGYFNRLDAEDVYLRLHDRYFNYMWDSLVKDLIEYDDGLNDDDRERSKEEGSINSFNIDRASFKQEDFLNLLEKDDRIKLNIRKLKRYLSGEEAPAVNSAEEGHKETLETSGITPDVVLPIPVDNGKGVLDSDAMRHESNNVISEDDAVGVKMGNMVEPSNKKGSFVF